MIGSPSSSYFVLSRALFNPFVEGTLPRLDFDRVFLLARRVAVSNTFD